MFGPYGITFAQPAWLWLLLVLPWFAWIGLRGRALLGPRRANVALLLRGLVVVLLICALAGLRTVRISDRLTVLFLLDRSRSIPEAAQAQALDYVNRMAEERPAADRAGVILFSKTAAVESPPLDFPVELREPLGALRGLDPNRTDLAAALKLALASFPEDAAKRIVIVSDGNQTDGDAFSVARRAAEGGVAIDVVAIPYDFRSEVLVESLTAPAEVRKDEPFELRTVLENTGPKPVRGRLIFSWERDGRIEDLNPGPEQQAVEIPPGKRLFSLPQRLTEANFHRYRVRFEPENPADDPIAENNVAFAVTQVAGAGRVLLVENLDEGFRGTHGGAVDRLRRLGLEVLVRGADAAFQSKIELQQFDAVILADVPREQFTEEQIAMLTEAVHDTGCGLVMLGGQNSFGAGGWAGTKLEEAMPVDFHIKAAEVVPKGALVLVMHASEMDMGNHWQKVVAKEAVKALGPQDLCGLVYWMGNVNWLWKRPIGLAPVGPERGAMLAHIDRMVPGDMPDFDPSLRLAVKAFSQLEGKVAVKHTIVISDGDPSPPSPQVIQDFRRLNVTVTAVAVGSHGLLGNQVMQNLANETGGKYYVVTNGNMLPAIYQKEARRVARPLIHEQLENPFSPQVVRETPLVRGFQEGELLPPITGYVMTTRKTSPLVEVSILAPVPSGDAVEQNRTILAHWRYGLGRTAAFTTDAGQRWSTAWTGSEKFDRLLYQIVQSVMRPTGDTGKYSVAAHAENGEVRVVVNALDDQGRFANFRTMSLTVLRPGGGESESLALQQDAPGRYTATFRAEDAGSYVLAISTGPDEPLLRTGIDLPYSNEFRSRSADLPLLKELAGLTPAGGEPGLFLPDPTTAALRTEPGSAAEAAGPGPTSPFRRGPPPVTAGRDAWPWCALLAGCVFFADVLHRRVRWSWNFLSRFRRGGRETSTSGEDDYLVRLRERKEAVRQGLERHGNRENRPPASPLPSDSPLPPANPQGSTAPVPPKSGEESYAERLLRAKNKAWDNRRRE